MTIVTVSSGCPICGGDVKGNDDYRFFCRPCNLLFRRADLSPAAPKTNAASQPAPPYSHARPHALPAMRPAAPPSREVAEEKPDLDKIARLFT